MILKTGRDWYVLLCFLFLAAFCTIYLLIWIGFLQQSEVQGSLWTILVAAVQLLPLSYLLRYGRLVRSYWAIPVVTGILLLVVGALAKIQHWPLGGILLNAGLVMVPFAYLIHFLRKTAKHLPDVLKLLWVLLYSLSALLVLQHIITRDGTYHIPEVLIILLYAALLLSHLRAKRPPVAPPPAWDFDDERAV